MVAGAGGLAAAEPADGPMAANVSPHERLLLPSPPAEADTAVFPVQGSAGFGETAARFGAWRGGRRHEGQDVFAPAGSPLFALRDGEVVETGDDGGRGNYIAVFNPHVDQTWMYLHMQDPPRAEPGDWLRAGQRVGAVGCTGSCWGDHLHLELRLGRGTQGKPVDPLPLLLRLKPR
jgi:murein DD-endopeptidase MepM/ murein hydrolase activator NlpD